MSLGHTCLLPLACRLHSPLCGLAFAAGTPQFPGYLATALSPFNANSGFLGLRLWRAEKAALVIRHKQGGPAPGTPLTYEQGRRRYQCGLAAPQKVSVYPVPRPSCPSLPLLCSALCKDSLQVHLLISALHDRNQDTLCFFGTVVSVPAPSPPQKRLKCVGTALALAAHTLEMCGDLFS